MKGGNRRRRIVLGAFLIVLAWLGVSTWLVVSARSAAEKGAVSLRAVRQRATVSAILEPATRQDLDAARRNFERASGRLDNPVLWPLRAVPVVSRHLAASRQLAASAGQSVEVADATLASFDRLVKRPHSTGRDRLALLADLSRLADQADRDLAGIDLPSPNALISPLGNTIGDLREQQAQARTATRRMAAVSDALATVLRGPNPYLLLGANNAEMRAGTGMYLSATTVRFDEGTLKLDDVQPTAEIVRPPGSVTVSGDLQRNWPWLDPGRDLRNVALTADFGQVAPAAVANWATVPGGAQTVGAIVLDVDGIRALLRAVGPVEVDGVRYSADNVRGELLREQYRRFAGDRDVRRDQLGDVAQAIFARLQAGKWEVGELANQLVDAVAERHLMVWSLDPALARTWRQVGADGHLSSNSLAVSLLNRGAEKLDSWINTESIVTHEPGTGGSTRLTLRYRITNTAPGDGPAYLVGPNIAGLKVGDHRGLAVVNLPAGAQKVTMTGARVFLTGGDGPTEVIAGEITVRRGETVTVTVTAVLPRTVDDLVLEPSARISPTRWRVQGRTFERDRRRTVRVHPA